MNESRYPIVESACAAADPSLDANDFIEVAPEHESAAHGDLAERNAAHAESSDDADNTASTLIEFPVAGKNTRNRPQWRKDLSERVREIQERRARDASRQDGTDFAQTYATQDSPADKALPKSARDAARTRRGEPSTTQTATKNSLPLNLVPPTEQPPPNPIVVAALRRVERARQNASMSHHYQGVTHGHGGTATARAYAPSEQANAEIERDAQLPFVAPDLQTESQADSLTLAETTHAAEQVNQPDAPTEKSNEPRVKLVAIPTRAVEPTSADATAVDAAQALTTEAAAPTRPALTPRRVTSVVVDETFLTKLESEQYAVNARSEHGVPASLSARLIGGVIDLAFAGILTMPFATIIAWLGGEWTNAELRASLVLVYAFVLFGYLTVAVALVGRTLGMKLFSLRTFDARTGLLPTAGRSAQRAVWHILSLACAGLGVLSALIDRDQRTVPDRLTQTRVLRVSK